MTHDTDPEIRARQVVAWRAMTSVERAALAVDLGDEVDALARSGIRHDRPDLDDRGVARELARRRYGPDVAAAFDASGD